MVERITSVALEGYLNGLADRWHPEIVEMEAYAKENNFPIIGPAAGNFCFMLARLMGARQVFEMGSGFGYSTAWFARAVAENGGGVVHHVVWDAELSRRAKGHLAVLGFTQDIVYKVREATLALSEAEEGFDIIFMDIDKTGYPDALPVIERKIRPGGVMIVDNVFWSGRIFDQKDDSPETVAIREFNLMVAASPAWVTSFAPIRDGLLVAVRQ